MNERERTRISRFMSLVLRHKPQTIGIELDDNGWVEVAIFLDAMAANGREITREALNEVVATNSKKRFAFSADGKRIRASQGHSVEIDLAYEPAEPPEILYHGTVPKFLDAIRSGGIQKRKRHHVHLSKDIDTASNVGERRGAPVILEIEAAKMHANGLEFFVSANGVWLTDYVPVAYIRFPEGKELR